MSRQVTELDFRKPEFRSAKVEDYEFRDDGAIVRKDRWETGIHQIKSAVGIRGGFEVDEVVDAVLKLAGHWEDADPEEDPGADLIDLRLSCGTVLARCERGVQPFTYRWQFGGVNFTNKDFGADIVEWQKSPEPLDTTA